MLEPARIISKISLVLADVDGTLVTKEKVLHIPMKDSPKPSNGSSCPAQARLARAS
jgi:hypothetical protein